MKKSTLMYFALFVGVWVAATQAQSSKYPSIEEYLMLQADEIALARTAALWLMPEASFPGEIR